MSFFNKFFQELTGSKEESSFEEKGVLLNEEINHNQTFLSNYDDWISSGMHLGILEHIKEMWQIRSSNRSSDVNLFLHESNLSNGFYTRGEEPWDTDDYSFLIHYIKNKLQTKGYVIKNKNREVVEEGGLLKTIELFYLKPSLKYRREMPFDQFFGNIEIQHRMVDGDTKILKLVANVYSERSYKNPYDFEDLMNFIFVP